MAEEDLDLEVEAAPDDAEDEIWNELAVTAPAEDAGPDVPRETPPATPAAAPEKTSFLREGETTEQAVERLGSDLAKAEGRATANWHDYKAARDELKAAAAEMAQMKATYAAWARHYEAQERAKLAAELPDPELEPEKATLAELKAMREEMAAERARRTEEARNAALTEEQQREAAALAAADNAAYQEAATALGLVPGTEKDPEFEVAWTAIEGSRWRQISWAYPQATDDQKMEGINALRALDARKARAQGIGYVDYLKQMHAAIGGGIAAPAPANGRNGRPGAPTVQDLEKAAAKAAKSAGLRRAPAGGGVKPPATLEDLSRLSAAEQARVFEQAAQKGRDLEGEMWEALADDTPYGR